MCGRFASIHTPNRLQQWYDALAMPDFPIRYNIAPSASIVVLRCEVQGRVGAMMRWGFIPAWAKDPATMPMLNNARGETVAEKPMFRQAFRRRRCLIPASGFYEWKAVPGQRAKQPFYISSRDGNPLSFAGIWETTKNAEGERLDTCAIITTEANAVVQPIHHRMPVVIGRADWNTWLTNEEVALEELMSLIKPFNADTMQVWGVAHAVNKVGNNDPSLLRPIA
jgi:putative SOS response-associated peptidase YedK